MHHILNRHRIICFIFLISLASNCFAEELNADFLKNVTVTLNPAKETEVKSEDEKLAKAIAQASAYAYSMKEDLMYFPYENVLLIVKKCRYTYKRDNEKMDFIQYVKQDLNFHYVNNDNWIKYIKAFQEE